MKTNIQTLEQIKELIKNEIPESTYLEYKGAKALDKSESKKKEISKDISAFANADGGTLIYGVGEHDNLPTEIEFIDSTKFSQEWLDQVIHSNIQRKIQGLDILSISNPEKPNECIYVVTIPRSSDAPHLAKTSKFHIRRNFHIQEMEEYEIREAYKRTSSIDLSDLRLIPTDYGTYNWSPNLYHEIKFNVMVNNIGGAIEKDFKLKIYSEKEFVIYATGKFKDGFTEAHDCFIRENVHVYEYEILGKTKLFQDENCTILEGWKIRVDKSNIEEYSHLKIHLHLYYSQGILKSTYELKDFYLDSF